MTASRNERAGGKSSDSLSHGLNPLTCYLVLTTLRPQQRYAHIRTLPHRGHKLAPPRARCGSAPSFAVLLLIRPSTRCNTCTCSVAVFVGWNPRQGAFVRGQVLVFHPNARKLSTNTTSLVITSMRVDGMATYSASHHGSVSGLWLVRHRSSVNNLDRGPASFVLATFTFALAHG